MLKTWLFLIVLFFSAGAFAQSDSTRNRSDFQIFLKQPAKEIHLIWYEKNFMPVQGKLSEDRKSVIIKNYDRGARVRVKVEYEDGTIDEFVKSPCFIDPVVS